MFRRQSRAEPATTETADAEVIKEAGKGRPTPRRRDSQRPRRQLGVAPKDRKEAARQQREANRAQRAKVREAMQTGDDRYLPARDKGPVRRFARDFIDSRRSAAEFFLFGALLILALSILPSAPISFAVGLAWVGMCIVIIVDSILITRRKRRSKCPCGSGNCPTTDPSRSRTSCAAAASPGTARRNAFASIRPTSRLPFGV